MGLKAGSQVFFSCSGSTGIKETVPGEWEICYERVYMSIVLLPVRNLHVS